MAIYLFIYLFYLFIYLFFFLFQPTELDRESRSSGHSSGQDSLSWHRASHNELSSSDSGAELEAPVSRLVEEF